MKPDIGHRTDAGNGAEIERLSAELKAAREEQGRAEARARAKEELLTHTSHEIRSQLQIMSSAAELLGETPLDPAQFSYVNSLQHANRLLLSIVNDILDSSRLEAGRFALDSVEFSPADLVRAAEDLLSWHAGRKGLALECRTAPDLPPRLVGDPMRLQQVIVNLAGNAIKFTREGTITITVERATAEPPLPSSVMLSFTIEDTGIGIPGDKLDVIFERFVQGSPAIASLYGGTGLGLPISRRLVELMGGTVRVESEVGKGSRFIFTVRLDEPEATLCPEVEASPAAATRERTLRILLADDAGDIRRLITVFIASSGHSVEWAENGEQAVEMFKRGEYDLVLMDMQMPVMDGLCATRRIREWELEQGRAPVPVVALTAGAEQSNLRRTREAGCTAHIAKPISKETLLRAIGACATREAP